MARREQVPFDSEPPAVAAGDPIEVRDVSGVWHDGRVALDSPRYDDAHGHRWKVFLTVPICTAEDFAGREFDAPWVNWPAEDVRPAAQGGDDA